MKNLIGLFYSLARSLNTVNHLFKGTILKRLVNIGIGRLFVSKLWRR